MSALIFSLARREAIVRKAHEKAMDLRRFIRQEQTQGDLSPTDSAFLQRLRDYLEMELPLEMGMTPEEIEDLKNN